TLYQRSGNNAKPRPELAGMGRGTGPPLARGWVSYSSLVTCQTAGAVGGEGGGYWSILLWARGNQFATICTCLMPFAPPPSQEVMGVLFLSSSAQGKTHSSQYQRPHRSHCTAASGQQRNSHIGQRKSACGFSSIGTVPLWKRRGARTGFQDGTTEPAAKG